MSRMICARSTRPLIARVKLIWSAIGFDKAGGQLAWRRARSARAGLVATSSIRGGREPAWCWIKHGDRHECGSSTPGADEPWVVDGAAVRSITDLLRARRGRVRVRCSTRRPELSTMSSADLTSTRDLTLNRRSHTGFGELPQSRITGVRLHGRHRRAGPFDVPGELAREWLRLPANPNGRPNSDVLKPWINGMDLTRRPAGKWIIDFGARTMSEADAALYEEPFTLGEGPCLPNAPAQSP